ncbi:MAG TPA: hypothetical protein VFH50_06925 [Acidimicrobiales bacterium]|nr:hypothetical protein [Acidimicrobiales bacterium]
MSSRWWSGRAVALHVTALSAVLAFCLLARWQVHRALSGNTLSWAYAFEWPFFAAYVVYMWWRLLRDTPGGTGRVPAPPDPEEERQRAAYNRYLEGLAAEDGRSPRRQRA